MASARADLRTPAGSDFGKPAVNYPFDDIAFPQVVESHDKRQNQALPAFLSQHIRTDLYPSCLLTKIEGPAGDNQNINVTFTWETLPGPWIPFTRYDDELGPIQGRRRNVVNTGQVASLTSTVKTTYEARDLSDIVSWQIEEAFGAGVPGFSSYPILTGDERSEQVRGENVRTTSTIVAAGTSPYTSSLVISSTVTPINNQISTLRNVYLAELPPDETWAFWEPVSLPTLLFDIINTPYCNNSQFFTMVTNFMKSGGSSVLRKHRITVAYHTTYPNPDLSASSFTTADLQYAGKVINFSMGNVLNDAISFDGIFYTSTGDGSCSWEEAYDYAATVPSATAFLAGAWYVKDFKVEPFGQSMYRSTKVEFYSAEGNPSIV